MSAQKFWNWLGLPSVIEMQALTSLCQAQEQRLIELEVKAQAQEKALQILLENLDQTSHRIITGINEESSVAYKTLLDRINTVYQEAIEQEANDTQIFCDRLDAIQQETRKNAQEANQSILSVLQETAKQSNNDQSIRAENMKGAILDDLHQLTQQIGAMDHSSVAAREQLVNQIKDLYTLTSNRSENQEELLRMLLVNAVRDKIEGTLKENQS